MEVLGSSTKAHATTENTAEQRQRFALIQPWALGLCFLLSLQHQLTGFLYPSSAATTISPLFVSGASAVLLLAYCYVSYRKDSSVFSARWSIALSTVATITAIIAGSLIAEHALAGIPAYVAAIIIGFSLAALTYTWATIYVRMTAAEALTTGTLALLLSGVLNFAGMHAAAFCGAWPLIMLFGAGACICFITSTNQDAAVPPEKQDTHPVLYLPTKMKEYTKLVCGIALYALAVGIVAGTTAANSTMDSMGTLNASVNRLHLIAALILAVAALALGKRANLALFLRVFTPLLVAVFLLNIVAPDYAGTWLACTLFAWTLLQLFTFLLAVHVARQRIASLSLAFPIVWSLVLCGNAVGVLIGQLYVATYGTEQHLVFAMAVALTVLVVVASSLLLGNANTALSSVRQTESAAAKDSKPTTTPDVTTAPSQTPLEAACASLAQSHHLSERETEVFAMLARGYTRTSIAKKLFVSENTVRVHVKNIYAKLYVHSKQQLIDLVDAKAGTR